MSRLTKRHSDGTVGISQFRYYNYDDFQKLARKLAEYEDLEEQGKLLKIPCKVGDVVYYINEKHKIEEIIIINSRVLTSSRIVYEGAEIMFTNDIVNKSIFLTKEEAEKELKRLESE